jgi:hypothetical protein
MNVDIDVGRNQRGFRKAMGCRDWIVAACRKTVDTTDATVIYRYQWILQYSAWTQESPRRYRADHRCPFVSSAWRAQIQ